MRAKVELLQNSKVIKSFWYQGPSGCRLISKRIREKYPELDIENTTFRLVQQKGLRVCVECQIEDE